MIEKPQLAFDLGAGREAAERGVAAVESHNADFVARLREAAKAHAICHGSVTADDVRRLAAAMNLRPKHRNCWGAIFSGRGWRRVGEQPSRLTSNHAHVNPIWAWDGPSALSGMER
jgi:hypothetical protein